MALGKGGFQVGVIRLQVELADLEDTKVNVWALGVGDCAVLDFWKKIKGKGNLPQLVQVAHWVTKVVGNECEFLRYLSAILPLPPPDLYVYWPLWEVAGLVGNRFGLRVDTSYILVLDETGYKRALEAGEGVAPIEGILGVRDFSYKARNVLLLGGVVGSVSFIEELVKLLVEEGGVQAVFAVFVGVRDISR